MKDLYLSNVRSQLSSFVYETWPLNYVNLRVTLACGGTIIPMYIMKYHIPILFDIIALINLSFIYPVIYTSGQHFSLNILHDNILDHEMKKQLF